jgi:hypothetical protein
MCAAFGGFVISSTALPTFLNNRAVFYRERASFMYAPSLWALVAFVTECLVWIPIAAIAIQIPAYFMIGMRNTADAFFKYFFAIYICFVVFLSISSVIAAIAPTAPAAGIIQSSIFGYVQLLISLLFVLFLSLLLTNHLSFLFFYSIFINLNGYVHAHHHYIYFYHHHHHTLTIPCCFPPHSMAIPASSVPVGWFWLFRALPLSHVTMCLLRPQFEGNMNSLVIQEGANIYTTTVSEYVSEYMGFSYEGYWEDIGWIILFIAVAQAGTFIATKYLVFSTR